MKDREVIERDFRMPEYRDAKVEDYEFRDDGKLVRKDRWQVAIFSIASALGMNGRSGFEIDEVVAAVEALVEALENKPAATPTARPDDPLISGGGAEPAGAGQGE